MRKPALTLLLLAAIFSAPVSAQDGERAIIDKSLSMLNDMQTMPDLQVPDWLLQRAEGIAILPEVVKAGAIVGGRGGTGVLLVRRRDGGWSNPLFVGLGAGSFGWQFGVQAADIVLVFTTRKSVEGITDGKLTLGGDAAAVAGPVGRSATAATSVTLDAEVYSYSRAKGLFAGVSLEGSMIFIRDAANERFYGKPGVAASDIIAADAPLAPAPGPALIEQVTRLTTAAAAPATSPPPPPATTSPAGTKPATPPAEAETFPLADPNPGAEPN
jgi:lipid-binding SYLF domain-containing protein